MKTTDNTILITGGGSGIGFETAKLFAQSGNTVIITGRNLSKLQKAADVSENIVFIQCDVTDEVQVKNLASKLEDEFGGLNILMNNAGLAHMNPLANQKDTYKIAAEEMNTNYLSVVNLTAQLLPLLEKQSEAAVINVSSIVAMSPAVGIATYSASKAALHAYTQTLRAHLAKTGTIKVFDVMPPLVDTDFAKDIPSESKLSPLAVAEAIINGVKNNNDEIHMGLTEIFHQNFFSQSATAFATMNPSN